MAEETLARINHTAHTYMYRYTHAAGNKKENGAPFAQSRQSASIFEFIAVTATL